MYVGRRKFAYDSVDFVVILEYFVDIFSTVIVSEAFNLCVILLFNLANKGLDCCSCVRFSGEKYDCGVTCIVVDEGDVIVAFTDRWSREFSGQIGVD